MSGLIFLFPLVPALILVFPWLMYYHYLVKLIQESSKRG